MIRVAQHISRTLDVHTRGNRDPQGPRPAFLVDHRDAIVKAARLADRGGHCLGDDPSVLRGRGRQQDGVVVALDLHRGGYAQLDGAAVVVVDIIIVRVVEVDVLAVVVVCVVHIAQMKELGCADGTGGIVCGTLRCCLLS